MALTDRFLPALAFATLLARDPQMQDVPFAVARKDMDYLLDQAVAQLHTSPPEVVHETLFAVCAFVDEMILTSSWPGRAEWFRRPLQRERFHTVNAGEEFYTRLNALCRQEAAPPTAFAEEPWEEMTSSLCPRELLEVYATCLALGFRGRYYTPEGQKDLDSIIETHFHPLLAQSPALEKRLFPEVYAPRPQGPPPSSLRPLAALAVLFGVPALLTMIIHAAYASLLTSSAQEWLHMFLGLR